MRYNNIYQLFFLSSLLLPIFTNQKPSEVAQEINSLNLRDQCLSLPYTICTANGGTVLAPKNQPKHLIGYWNFDDAYSLDKSVNANDMHPPAVPGPSAGGHGYSAYYDGNNMGTIPHSNVFETDDISVSFWIFLLKDSIGGYRTIIHKGSNSHELTPTIMLWPNERRLHILTNTDAYWNENLDSKGLVQLRRWTHITAIFSNQLLELYINGMVDTQQILKGQVRWNKGPFHVGKDPWHPGTDCYLDDLRVYSTILKPREIKSLAAPNLSMTGPDFAQLGCMACNFAQAMNSCQDQFHLCSIKELFAGAYHIARTQGWLRAKTQLWTKPSIKQLEADKKKEFQDPNIYKVSICCSDY